MADSLYLSVDKSQNNNELILLKVLRVYNIIFLCAIDLHYYPETIKKKPVSYVLKTVVIVVCLEMAPKTDNSDFYPSPKEQCQALKTI